MPHATLLLCPDMLASSITLPGEMFHAAGQHYRVRHRRARPVLQRASAGGGPVRTADGLVLHADSPLRKVPRTDLLIIPTPWRSPARWLESCDTLLPPIRRLHRSGALVCAVSTGSYLLARTGLLNHRPATTHWRYLEDFAARHPLLRVSRSHLVTRAGRLYCAGSINAVADLMITLLEELFDAQAARRTALEFSPEIRRSHADRLHLEERAMAHPDEEVMEAQQWLEENWARPVSMSLLAARCGLKPRSFRRRFHDATGSSPGRYLQLLRMGRAAELLRDTNLAIAEVAALVGYPDSGYFAALFRRHMATSPRTYRRLVRGKLFRLHRS